MTRNEQINILNEIFSAFQMITQDLPNNLADANNYETAAATLIVLLEEDMFGIRRSRFKRGHKHEYELCGYRLYDRFWYIIKEGKFENDIKDIAFFNAEKMYNYFKILAGLRESFNK